MKRLIALAAVVAAVSVSLSVHAADVGVSISVGQPGVYGRIDIGRFPQPQLVVQRPYVVYQPVRHVAVREPVYMWVPPGHRKNWRKHCGAYGACSTPVYFVRDDWYGQQIRPRADGRRGYEWRDDRRDFHHDRRHDRRQEWRDDRRDDRRGDWRDHGRDDRRDGRPGR